MKSPFSSKLIIGLAILGFAGLVSFWLLISSVYLDEAGINLTTPPSVSTPSGNAKTTHRIFVNAANEIFIDNKELNIQQLKDTMKSERMADENQRIILRLDEDAKHTTLIEVKDMLDELNYDVKIEIISASEDGAK